MAGPLNGAGVRDTVLRHGKKLRNQPLIFGGILPKGFKTALKVH